MKLLSFFTLCRRQRPVTTPTALSMLLASGLLVGSLLVPDRANDGEAAAAEVQRVAVAPSRSQQPLSLRDRLIVGLQARLNTEVAFVETVVAQVQAGHIPQRIVDETFFWARQRSASRNGRVRRPIILFIPAMRARADRLGVEL